MPQLSEVISKPQLSEVVSKRVQSRKERIVPWTEFEPFLNQLRQALDCSNDDAMRTIGYGGSTIVAGWKRAGVPIRALNAIRYVLHDLKIPLEEKRPEVVKQFSYDDLLIILSALAKEREQNRGLIAAVAKEIATYYD